jgi:hypothetical protein
MYLKVPQVTSKQIQYFFENVNQRVGKQLLKRICSNHSRAFHLWFAGFLLDQRQGQVRGCIGNKYIYGRENQVRTTMQLVQTNIPTQIRQRSGAAVLVLFGAKVSDEQGVAISV